MSLVTSAATSEVTMPANAANRRIPYFGDFVLFDEIGRGGMGVVYNAQQTKLDRPVALKVLHTGLVGAKTGFQRLRVEAEAAARLEHPNIVPIFEIGAHEGQPYLAMQLVEGESLAERIAQLGPISNEKDAAALMAKIARAVHHAHERGVLHRDLKPGNILIDKNGEPHLIDFGLAKCLERDSGLTQTGVFLGTPAYASPEQAAGQNDSVTIASDIYSLGAILYALLAGQPPFVAESAAATIEKVKRDAPLRPRSVRPTLSANLETICLKCLEKEPARRYPSARALADDLDRFLEGRPITARQAGAPEQLWMWTRRNPVHAALWGMAVLVVLASINALFVWRNIQARSIEARNKILQRHLLLEEAQRLRLTTHSSGWFTQAWSRVYDAAKIQTAENSSDVRDQAAALLAGSDAYRINPFTNCGASSVKFDRKGNRMLVGGFGDGPKVWDFRTAGLQTSPHTNSGPLAFLDDGSPVQLLYDAGRRSLVLADAINSEAMRVWKIPEQMESSDVTNALPLVAATSNEIVVAAVLALADARQAVGVFRQDTFHVLQTLSSPVSAATISDDGTLVATAESGGSIGVWSANDGSHVATLMGDRNEVRCLTLKRTNRTAGAGARSSNETWLLAAGDSGGTVTLWDLRTGREKAHFRGGHYYICAIAFSPDGTTLASGGRSPVGLWDVATESLLLDIQVFGSGEEITGLDFAPDARRLAISGKGGNPHPQHLSIWNSDFARGIQALRGLSGQVSKVCFSSDGRKIAALSHTWEIGVWDLTSGQLHRLIEVAPGHLADNAAIIFSPNAERLVFSAREKAKMWDVKSGAELETWNLPPGFADQLSFPDEEHLLLVRVETLDGKQDPFRDALPTKYPRVCRIRNLMSQDWREKPLVEDSTFDLGVFNTAATWDGRCLVVEGKHSAGTKSQMFVKAYDGFTGQELWSRPTTTTSGSGKIWTDATCRFVSFQITDTKVTDVTNPVLADLSSGNILRTLPVGTFAIGPRGDLYAVHGDKGCRLFNTASDSHPLITLGIDGDILSDAQFDVTWNQLAWGNTDGSVTVCDLKEIQRRLKQAGLQW